MSKDYISQVARSVPFDNTNTDLVSTNTQDAIIEVNDKISKNDRDWETI